MIYLLEEHHMLFPKYNLGSLIWLFVLGPPLRVEERNIFTETFFVLRKGLYLIKGDQLTCWCWCYNTTFWWLLNLCHSSVWCHTPGLVSSVWPRIWQALQQIDFCVGCWAVLVAGDWIQQVSLYLSCLPVCHQKECSVSPLLTGEMVVTAPWTVIQVHGSSLSWIILHFLLSWTCMHKLLDSWW